MTTCASCPQVYPWLLDARGTGSANDVYDTENPNLWKRRNKINSLFFSSVVENTTNKMISKCLYFWFLSNYIFLQLSNLKQFVTECTNLSDWYPWAQGVLELLPFCEKRITIKWPSDIASVPSNHL